MRCMKLGNVTLGLSCYAIHEYTILYCVYHVCICRHRNEEDRHSHPLELDDASWELRPALSVFFNISRQTTNGSQLVSRSFYVNMTLL